MRLFLGKEDEYNNELKDSATQDIQRKNKQTEISKRRAKSKSVLASSANKDDVATKIPERIVPLEADNVAVMAPNRRREWNITTLLNEQILKFINKTMDFSYSNIEGTVSIRDLRVSQFQPPDITIVQFNEPQSILFDMTNLQVA